LSGSTGLNRACASANACSANWVSDCASHALPSPKLIRNCNEHTKKTPAPHERRAGRSVVHRRSPFSTARFPLPNVDSSRNQRSRFTACADQQGVGYFGAVRLSDGRFAFRREEDKFNGDTFFAFLRELRHTSIRTGRCVVVITDNAKYHHARLHKSWREQHAPRFALDFLPPYSPELNPIERVWKLTRRLCMHNRYFERLDTVITTVEAQFASWTKRNDSLRRLCAIT
jgi:transposase